MSAEEGESLPGYDTAASDTAKASRSTTRDRQSPVNEIERGTQAQKTQGRSRRERTSSPPNAPPQQPGSEGAFSERFITALDQRLAQSQLEELGWKGREDLNEVMRDLERLASVDFQRASTLWSKYRPDDKDKPSFLDNDELAAERRLGAAPGQRKSREEEPTFVAPEALRKRFIQADDKYYFRHDDNKLAFRDHGHKIETAHNDPVVALSMVQLAEAKGWQTVYLRGTEEFRREAWLHASLKGMDVKGYKPRDVDIEKLSELQKELGTTAAPVRNVVEKRAARAETAAKDSARYAEPLDRTAVVDEPQRSLTPQQRVVLDTVKAVWRRQGSSEKEVEIAAAATVERFQNQRVYVGTVAESGEAPFENDRNNQMSFYLKLNTLKGDKVIWGVDLSRALGEGSIRVGDEVVVANQGRMPVNVPVKERDSSGSVVGTSTITTNRNTWRVEKLESLREDALEKVKARAAQADRAPLIPVHDRDAERTVPRPDIKVERPREKERSR